MLFIFMPWTLLGVQRHTDIQLLTLNSENHEHQKYLWNEIKLQGKTQFGMRKLNHNQPSN